jgi:hypothetical protein
VARGQAPEQPDVVPERAPLVPPAAAPVEEQDELREQDAPERRAERVSPAAEVGAVVELAFPAAAAGLVVLAAAAAAQVFGSAFAVESADFVAAPAAA